VVPTSKKFEKRWSKQMKISGGYVRPLKRAVHDLQAHCCHTFVNFVIYRRVLLGSKKNFFENFPDFSFRIGW
jgi:hypothetical protein